MLKVPQNVVELKTTSGAKQLLVFWEKMKFIMVLTNPIAVLSTRVPILLQTLIVATSATTGLPHSSTDCSEILNLSEMLLDAARNGNTTLVGSLLDCTGVDVNTVDSQGFTPLHLASGEGHTDVVAMLVGQPDIDINMGGFSDPGWTPLHWACQDGHADVVRVLLAEPRIDVNRQDSNGWTVLYSATYEEYSDVVKLLVEHPNTDVNKKDDTDGYNALMWAAWNGNVDILESLLSHPQIDVNMADNLGETALFYASYNGQAESEKLILGHPNISFSEVARWLFSDEKAVLNQNEEMLVAAIMGNATGLELLSGNNESDINTDDSEGRTPLFFASWIGRQKVVKLLLENPEVDANKGDKLGITPLFVATKNAKKEIVEALVSHSNTDVNRSTPNRTSPLIIASQRGHADLVLVLLAQVNIDVNYVTFDGKSAIFYAFAESIASEQKQRSIVELILRCPRADVAIMDEDDKTALDHAKENNRTDVMEAFAARSKLKKKRGQTCCSGEISKGLQKAAKEGDLQWLETFLKCPQVDINLSDKFGFTPLYLASREGHLHVVQMFLENPKTEVNHDVNFENALMVASEEGHHGVVELLLINSKIDVNKINTRNAKTALIVAAEEGHSRVASLLLRHDQIDTNMLDTYGESALHKASRKGYLRVAKLLLRCKETKVSDELRRDGPRYVVEAIEWRETLLQIGPTCCFNVKEGLLRAAWDGDFRALRGLLQCIDSDINAVARKGRSPLYLASWRGHIQAVKVLLSDPRIDVNMVTGDGGSAFSIASEKGHFHIMRMLIDQRQTDVSRGWSNQEWTWLPSTCQSSDDSATLTTEGSAPLEGAACNSSHFRCATGIPECIPPAWVCDGEEECEDGYDEAREVCGKIYILLQQF